MAYSQILAFGNPSLFLTILPSDLEPIFSSSTTSRKDITFLALLNVIFWEDATICGRNLFFLQPLPCLLA